MGKEMSCILQSKDLEQEREREREREQDYKREGVVVAFFSMSNQARSGLRVAVVLIVKQRASKIKRHCEVKSSTPHPSIQNLFSFSFSFNLNRPNSSQGLNRD